VSGITVVFVSCFRFGGLGVPVIDARPLIKVKINFKMEEAQTSMGSRLKPFAPRPSGGPSLLYRKLRGDRRRRLHERRLHLTSIGERRHLLARKKRRLSACVWRMA
jgi:hypothetical protein